MELIPQHELDQILQDLKEDFDLDQLASELPCDEQQSVSAQAPSVATHPVPQSSQLMTIVPGSPANSSQSRPSPIPFDDPSMWLDEHEVVIHSSPSSSFSSSSSDTKPVVLRSDPLLSACHQESGWQQDASLLDNSSFNDATYYDPSANNLSPFNDQFQEEFFDLF